MRACPTSSSDGARRRPQPAPSEIWSWNERVSEKPVLGTWQPAHATRPVSPAMPSDCGLPSLSVSSSGPENDGSKKSFCPKAAAAALSAYALVTSAGGAGSAAGDSASSAARAAGVRTGSGSESASALAASPGVDASTPESAARAAAGRGAADPQPASTARAEHSASRRRMGRSPRSTRARGLRS